MYAIVEIGGHQYKVQKDQQLYVNRLAGEKGDKIQFEKVLLIDNSGKVNVGAPVIDGAAVEAKIVEHLRADKVIVFKKKRRKGYQKKNGHRQDVTSLEISKIVEKGAKKSTSTKADKPATATKKEAPKKEAPKAEVKSAKAEKPEKVKKPAKKKTAVVETTALKAASKKVSSADDLKKIEGIGPKSAEHLNNAGINTFADLASAKLETLQGILEAAGPRYRILNPGTWSEQAALARDDKWDELKKLQDELDGGKRKS